MNVSFLIFGLNFGNLTKFQQDLHSRVVQYGYDFCISINTTIVYCVSFSVGHIAVAFVHVTFKINELVIQMKKLSRINKVSIVYMLITNYFENWLGVLKWLLYMFEQCRATDILAIFMKYPEVIDVALVSLLLALNKFIHCFSFSIVYIEQINSCWVPCL